MNYLCTDYYPIIDSEEVATSCKMQVLVLKNYENLFNLKAPYLLDVKTRLVDVVNQEVCRLLIVAEDEKIAIKSATYCRCLYEYLKAMELYENTGDIDVEKILKLKKNIAVVKFLPVHDNNVETNKYQSQIAFPTDESYTIYTGLDNETNIEDKVSAILALDKDDLAIWIKPEQLKSAWVEDLIVSKDFLPLVVSDLPKDYYPKVFRKILKLTGFKLDRGIHVEDIVNKIRLRRGARFCEEDLDFYIQYAVNKAIKEKRTKLYSSDFSLFNDGDGTPIEKLNKMPGLVNVKSMISEFEIIAREKVRNPKLQGMHTNMIFSGNPGTGKTTCAKLLAESIAHIGASNNKFVVATRSDLVGRYVGHTAPMVSKKFDEARGGVLLVDEAGFFLQQENGTFTSEALKEFIRYMEIYSDVTVIFAMYEHEVDKFLSLDDGLSSRISRVIKFEDYSLEELYDIAEYMFSKNGYIVGKEAISELNNQLRLLKQNKYFGNARDVRKLVEACIISFGSRNKNRKDKDIFNEIVIYDIIEAGNKLGIKKEIEKVKVGFNICDKKVEDMSFAV